MQVIHRNRFVYGTKDLSRARKLQNKGLILGYMITNFNHLSFENGNVLEFMLDWFESYTHMSETPGKHLIKLLDGVHLFGEAACTEFDCLPSVPCMQMHFSGGPVPHSMTTKKPVPAKEYTSAFQRKGFGTTRSS